MLNRDAKVMGIVLTALIQGIFLFHSCQTIEPENQTPPKDNSKIKAGTISTDSSSLPALDYILGKFDPTADTNFIEIPASYAQSPGLYLRKETLLQFIQMSEAAQKEGIQFKILSATRNFKAQKAIWEAKWSGQRLVEGKNIAKTIPDPSQRALKILEYSSMPGTSRHHWGTDIDINNLNPSYFETEKGAKEYKWLVENGHKYGFCQPYTAKNSERPNGYNEEKWHWSYLPIAKIMTAMSRQHLKDSMINGFLGAETATSIHIVDNYILGINENCK